MRQFFIEIGFRRARISFVDFLVMEGINLQTRVFNAIV